MGKHLSTCAVAMAAICAFGVLLAYPIPSNHGVAPGHTVHPERDAGTAGAGARISSAAVTQSQ